MVGAGGQEFEIFFEPSYITLSSKEVDESNVQLREWWFHQVWSLHKELLRHVHTPVIKEDFISLWEMED